MSKQTQGHDLEDLTPSAKLVYKILEYEAPLTKKQIVEESRLTQRTVYNAITELEDLNYIDSEPRTKDLRQRIYWIRSQ